MREMPMREKLIYSYIYVFDHRKVINTQNALETIY